MFTWVRREKRCTRPLFRFEYAFNHEGIKLKATKLMSEEPKTPSPTDPSHIGEIIKEELLGQYGLNQQGIADLIRIPRPSFSRIITGQYGLSPESATKMGKEFQKYGERYTKKNHLSLQNDWELAQVDKKQPKKIFKKHAKKITTSNPKNVQP